MSKANYAIINGNNVLGVLWENDKLGKVLVLQGKIDVNSDLEIRNTQTGEKVKNIDLRDFLLEVLPV